MSEDQSGSIRQKNIVPSYGEVILIALIVACGALYGYDRFFAQKIRVVDMSGYLRQQKALMTAGEISIDDFKAGLTRVDQIVRQEADLHKNQIFILKEVVLKNGEEINIK